MVGVGRLELPTSASQMPRAADCAIPQNMSTQFFTWRVPPSHMIICGVITMLRTTFLPQLNYTAGLAVDSISLSSEERRPKLPES